MMIIVDPVLSPKLTLSKEYFTRSYRETFNFSQYESLIIRDHHDRSLFDTQTIFYIISSQKINLKCSQWVYERLKTLR
jgi:hypothetical protein